MRTLYFCPVVSASTSFKHIGLLKMHIVAIKKHPPAPMWRFFMAALHNRAGHYIFALWFLSIYLSSFFFPRLLLAAQVGCLPYFDTWCGPRANLECRSERCCTRLAANAGPKKVAKNRHLGTIPQLCRAISSQRRHASTIGKKNLLSSNISSTCPHNKVNFGPLAAETVSLVWGTPCNYGRPM